MTRAGPPLGSGLRTGLRLESGGRGSGRRDAGRASGLGTPGKRAEGRTRPSPSGPSGARGWGPRRGDSAVQGGSSLPERRAGLGPAWSRERAAGVSAWAATRGEPWRPRERAWASGPAARQWRGFRPRTRGTSVRGRLDTSSFYLDTASLFQPAGTCAILS